jgi:hypothetical protein
MITINIGLNNNPLNLEQVAKLLNQFKLFGLNDYAEKLGEYVGADEPTFVGELDFITANHVEALCEIMTQDCIAIYNHDTEVGELVYNPLYEGDKYTFDPKYFLFL